MAKREAVITWKQEALGSEWLGWNAEALPLTSYASFIKLFNFSVSVSSSVQSMLLWDSDHKWHRKCLQQYQVSKRAETLAIAAIILIFLSWLHSALLEEREVLRSTCRKCFSDLKSGGLEIYYLHWLVVEIWNNFSLTLLLSFQGREVLYLRQGLLIKLV